MSVVSNLINVVIGFVTVTFSPDTPIKARVSSREEACCGQSDRTLNEAFQNFPCARSGIRYVTMAYDSSHYSSKPPKS